MVVEIVRILWQENGIRYVIWLGFVVPYDLISLSCLPNLISILFAKCIIPTYHLSVSCLLLTKTRTGTIWCICSGQHEEASGAFWCSWAHISTLTALLWGYASTTEGIFSCNLLLYYFRHIYQSICLNFYIWIGWERDWWAKGYILPWCRLVSNWRDKVQRHYGSYPKCRWGLFWILVVDYHV